jgi:hypothetical protein
MLDHALGQLEGAPREQAEQEIANDPAVAHAVDRLTRAVHQLVDDGETIVPPEGLARRTLTFVAEQRRRRSILDFVPVAVPFRWADLAVAAGIFLASVLTLIPAFRRSQQQMDQAGCGFNLQQLGVSLAQYASQHGQFPYAPAGHPSAVSGSFAVTLHDSDLLHDLTTLDCPCNGSRAHTAPMPKLADLRSTPPEHVHRALSWDYAYHAGYRQDSGRAGPVPARLAARIPLLADQPPHQIGRILEGNSPNHNGRGQNVLFSDGHYSWHDSRRVSPADPDLFLNAEHQAGPGVDVHDAALLPSLCPFTGW